MSEWATRTRWRSGASAVTKRGGNRPRVPPISSNAWVAPSVVSLPARVPIPSLTHTQADGWAIPDPVRPVGIVEQPLLTAIIDPKPDAVPTSLWVPSPSWSSGAVPIAASVTTETSMPTVDPGDAGIYWVPPSIDQTGTTDVSDPLNAFIATVPDGSTIRFQPNGTYRCENILVLYDRHNLVVDGNGATVRANTNGAGVTPPIVPGINLTPGGSGVWPRQRAHWLLRLCTNITFTNMKIVGPNTLGGLQSGFFPAYEEQGGWVLNASNDITIMNCEVSYVYGDGAEGMVDTRGMTVTGCNFHHIGRQGVAFVWGANLLVENSSIHYVSRSIVDLEPAGFAPWYIDGAIIRGNTMGGQVNMWVTAQGRSRVDNVLVENNIVDLKASSTFPLGVRCYASDGTRRRNWTIRNNANTTGQSNGSPTAVMTFRDMDGVVVTGNSDYVFGKVGDGSGQSGKFVETTRCCLIDVSGNALVAQGGGPAIEWTNNQDGYVCP